MRRIELADSVALVKYLTAAPIDDETRERQLLTWAWSWAARAGMDPGAAQRFCRQQIEASKHVQRGLHALWAEFPDRCPVRPPDLGGELRPALDEITLGMLERLAGMAVLGARSGPLLHRAVARQRNRLDRLHWDALRIAFRSATAETDHDRYQEIR